MKKIITLLTFTLFTIGVTAQAPQKMSYQAVIRNAANTLVTNQLVGMKISVLQGTSTGTAVYVETQTATTNANGLVSLEIGSGAVVSGTFSGINWSTGSYFIKTETDPTGGTSYTINGTSQLLSVPYALFSGNSGGSLANGTAAGNSPYWDGTGWITNSSNIFNNGGNVGLGTTTPTSKLEIIDAGWNGLKIKSNGSTIGSGIIFKTDNSAVTGQIGVNGSATGVMANALFITQNGPHPIKFATNFADRMIVTGAGDIGVGTMTPAAKLDVAGTVKIADGTQGVGKVLTSDAAGLATWQVPAGSGLAAGSAAGNTPYWNGTTWVTNNSNIFNNGGNVGIGTSSPTQLLQVGNTSTGHHLTYQSNGGSIKSTYLNETNFRYTLDSDLLGGGFAGLGFNPASGANPPPLAVNGAAIGSPGQYQLGLYTSNATSLTERVRIDGAGNVGIGTATPAAKLDVAGTVKIADGTQGVGKVLTSDAAGLASWVTPAGGPLYYNKIFTSAAPASPFPVDQNGSTITFNVRYDCTVKIVAGGTMYIDSTNGNVTLLGVTSNTGSITAAGNVISLGTTCGVRTITFTPSVGSIIMTTNGPALMDMKMTVMTN